MKYSLEVYSNKYEEAWDTLVSESPVGTFLHSRSFLSYHKDRFLDCSFVLINKEKGALEAVFPCALDKNSKLATSHPGSTYGGIVTRTTMTPEILKCFLDGIIDQLKVKNVEELVYKITPDIYRLDYSNLDEYFIWQAQGTNYRNDLSNIIDLHKPFKFSSRRKRGIKKAQKYNVTYSSNCDFTNDIWKILESNLAEHNVKPVHSLDEIKLLKKKFPNNIFLHMALDVSGQPLCGVVAFHMGGVVHAQYIFSSPEARECGALDFLFATLIELAIEDSCSYFSFGASSEMQGQLLNNGLYNFKAEFGSRGVLNRTYRLKIK